MHTNVNTHSNAGKPECCMRKTKAQISLRIRALSAVVIRYLESKGSNLAPCEMAIF